MNFFEMFAELTPYIGTLGTVALSLVFTIGYMFRRQISEKIEHWAENTHKLKNHDLFRTITAQKAQLNYLDFPEAPNKAKILRDFLRIKLEEIETQTLDFVTSDEQMELNGEDLETAVNKLFYSIVDTHDKRWEEHFRKRGIDADMIELMIKSFNKWHKNTVRAIGGRCTSIFNNGYYKTKYQQLTAILEVFTMGVDLACSEGVQAFREMNGKLEKIEYKN